MLISFFIFALLFSISIYLGVGFKMKGNKQAQYFQTFWAKLKKDPERLKKRNEKQKEYRKKNPKKYSEYYKNQWETRKLNNDEMWEKFLWSADKRGWRVEITREQWQEMREQKCYLCGDKGDPYNGIDRRDNSKGYEMDNCRPCCAPDNKGKWKYSEEDYLKRIEQVYNYRIKK